MSYKKVICLIVSLLILVILLVIYAHYQQLTKTKDSLQLCQIESKELDKIHLSLKDGCPLIIKKYSPQVRIDDTIFKDNITIINGIIKNRQIKKITLKEAFEQFRTGNGGFSNLIIKGLLSENLLDSFKKISSPITIYNNTSISFLAKDFKSSLTKRLVNINLFLVERGSISFQLYHPKYSQYLETVNSEEIDEVDKNLNYSQIWKTVEKLSDKANYIEVILRKGQVLIIPNQWIYNYRCLENSSLINYTSVDFIASVVLRLDD